MPDTIYYLFEYDLLTRFMTRPVRRKNRFGNKLKYYGHQLIMSQCLFDTHFMTKSPFANRFQYDILTSYYKIG